MWPMWQPVTSCDQCDHIAYSYDNYQSPDLWVAWPQHRPMWPNTTKCDQLRSIWADFLQRDVPWFDLKTVSNGTWFLHAQTVASAAGSIEGFSSCSLPLSPFPSHTPTAKASAHFSIVALNLWPPSTATALVHIFTYRTYHGPWNTDGSTYEICTESAHLVPNIFSNFSLPNSNFTSYAISSWSGNFFLAQPAHLSSSSLFSFHSKRFLLQLQVCSKKKG